MPRKKPATKNRRKSVPARVDDDDDPRRGSRSKQENVARSEDEYEFVGSAATGDVGRAQTPSGLRSTDEEFEG
jgi:hypothetical protein